MTVLSNASLWQRILDYQFDKPDIQFSFTQRLARENGWSPDFARRVVEEYRKFIYLICISAEMQTPSEEVDQAWHLHMTYTRDYWQRFCRDTVGREIHHEPTEGGPVEREKFSNAYRRTLDNYERTFGSRPPDDIWPAENIRFGMASGGKLAKPEYFLIRKEHGRLSAVGIAAISATTAVIWSGVTPGFALFGSLFIFLLMGLILGALVASSTAKAGDGGGGCGAGGCGGGCGGCG